MSMADDSKLRFSRAQTLHSTATAERTDRSSTSSDPLAELARLIGQDDVFNQMRRDAARADTRPDGRRPQPESQPEASPVYPYRKEAPHGGQDYSARDEGAHEGPPTAVHAAPHAESYYADGPADAQATEPAVLNTQDPYEDAHGYEEEPAPAERRRGGLVTIAAVLGLAVIGTAGAFGYRAITGGSDNAQPPVIKAADAPTKIVPAPVNRDVLASKTTYDRAAKPQSEKLGTYEEQPIDMKEAKAPPKMVVPAAGGAIATGAPSQVLPSPSGQVAAINPNEPKKVRTLAIRPDGTVAPESTAARAPVGTRPVASAPSTSSQPMPPIRPTGAPQAGTPGPLAIAPSTQSGDSVRPPANIPLQTGSIRPSAPTAGSHVVQLASQKTEADAQASFRAIQAKYPAVLGNRQPLIRRVELADRGTYYRAQVGPFASMEQANELCTTLKAAGGQCIVQRN